MNKKGDIRLSIGIFAACSLILLLLAIILNWPAWLGGIFVLIFIIALIFWKFTR